MRIGYLDCFSGISGDMFLGALVDAGLSPQLFEETVRALNVGARLEITRVNRSGITATKVDVHTGEEHSGEARASSPSAHDDSRHTRAESDSRAGIPHGESHGHGRSLKQIKKLISEAAIVEKAKTNAMAVFEALGKAEAKIHGVDIEKIHFHEVGAVDAIVDIVCTAVGVHALGMDQLMCSPLNLGGGTVRCAHGTFPVPAPATVELLKDAPVYSSGVQAELVTPTGAALVKVLASGFGSFPKLKIEKAGYGAGTRDFPEHANVLRLTIGESQVELAGKVLAETVTVLQANLDDLNPQVFGYVMDRLLEEGALEVFAVPVQMKKSRPGIVLTVLSKPQDGDRLSQLIFAETTTLGVRRREEQRQTLARKWITVATRWGDVRVKIASMNGTVTNYAPEYEDCRRIAAEQHVPLKRVMQEAVQAYLQSR